MKVSEIMKKPIKINSNKTVYEASILMKEKNFGSLVVEHKNKIEGIITERDILNRLVAENKSPKETLIKDIMTKDLIIIDYNSSIENANILMTKNNIRRILIQKDNEIIGIITLRDISQAIKDLIKQFVINELS